MLLVGLLRGRFIRRQVVPFLTLVALGVTAGRVYLAVGHQRPTIVAGALAIDDLTLTLTLVFVVGGIAARCCCRGARSAAAEAGEGEYYALLLSSVLGMVVLVAADEPRRRCSSASSCCRSRCTCCARRTCAASTRWSRA